MQVKWEDAPSAAVSSKNDEETTRADNANHGDTDVAPIDEEE
jgi:hypothetical protein